MSDSFLVIENFDTVGDWTALNDDCTTVAASTNRLTSSGSVSFAKANGSSNTVYAIIDRALAAGENDWFQAQAFGPQDRIGIIFYVSATTNVAGGVVRIGSTDANYLEWRMADTHAGWNMSTAALGDSYLGGTGFAPWGTEVKPVYFGAGVQFDAEANALAGCLVDCVFLSRNVPTIS